MTEFGLSHVALEGTVTCIMRFPSRACSSADLLLGAIHECLMIPSRNARLTGRCPLLTVEASLRMYKKRPRHRRCSEQQSFIGPGYDVTKSVDLVGIPAHMGRCTEHYPIN